MREQRRLAQIGTTAWLAVQILGAATTVVGIVELARHKPVHRGEMIALLAVLGSILVAQFIQILVIGRAEPEQAHLDEIRRSLRGCVDQISSQRRSGLPTLPDHRRASLARHYRRDIRSIEAYDRLFDVLEQSESLLRTRFQTEIRDRQLTSPEFVNLDRVWQLVTAAATTPAVPPVFRWHNGGQGGYLFWGGQGGTNPQVVLDDDDPDVVRARTARFESFVLEACTWPETADYARSLTEIRDRAGTLTADLEATLRNRRRHKAHCADC